MTEKQYRLIIIGGSLGGMQALVSLLVVLPADFPVPIVVVLHRHVDSDALYLPPLQDAISLPVVEAQDKMTIAPRRVYLAPADYHLLVEEEHFALTTDAPQLHARPAINVAFQSAAESYGAELIGIILAGASRDGVQGLAEVKRRGGLTIVQEPRGTEERLLPTTALKANKVDHVLSPEKIGKLLLTLNVPQNNIKDEIL